MRLKTFLKLIRFNVQLNSLMVLVGYYLALNFNFSLKNILYIAWSYLLIMLMYGAIYITNDIQDLERDKKHPEKSKGRAIAAGEISVKSARMISIVLVIVSTILGAVTAIKFFYMQLIFLTVTTTYTFLAKKYAYWDVLFNALTHPLRTATGIVVAGASVLVYKDLLITHFVSALCMATGRRYREYINGTLDARPSLRQYNVNTLKAMQLILSTANAVYLIFSWNISKPLELFTRIVMILVPIVMHFCYYKGSPVKTAIDNWYFGKA